MVRSTELILVSSNLALSSLVKGGLRQAVFPLNLFRDRHLTQIDQVRKKETFLRVWGSENFPFIHLI